MTTLWAEISAVLGEWESAEGMSQAENDAAAERMAELLRRVGHFLAPGELLPGDTVGQSSLRRRT